MSISNYSKASESSAFLSQIEPAPTVAVVLGSGLSIFADRLHDTIRVPYAQIPYFHHSTVPGHAGELVVGSLANNTRIVALCGRSHLYEGLPVSSIVHPTRTLAQWGVTKILYTNAAGGISPNQNPGDLMLITDHINLTGQNPISGPIEQGFGSRFVDMTNAYDPVFCDEIRKQAQKHATTLQEGTYVGLLGPSYETPAEIRMLQAMGAHAVGMSTVLEVIAARQSNIRVAGISCITNLGAGIQGTPLNHSEVKETALLVRETFGNLLENSLSAIHEAL